MEPISTIHFSKHLQGKSIQIFDESELAPAILELGFSEPRHTLALVGGASGMNRDEMEILVPLFDEILIPFIESSHFYVVDGGTNSGVMQLMGQARWKANASFPLIGIAVREKVILPDQKVRPPDATELEPHHSHFIFVPGQEWGDESKWIDKIVNQLSYKNRSLTILINGGDIAREDIKFSMLSSRPILVIAGTGRLADELAQMKRQHHLINIIHISEGEKRLTYMLKTMLGDHWREK